MEDVAKFTEILKTPEVVLQSMFSLFYYCLARNRVSVSMFTGLSFSILTQHRRVESTH